MADNNDKRPVQAKTVCRGPARSGSFLSHWPAGALTAGNPVGDSAVSDRRQGKGMVHATRTIRPAGCEVEQRRWAGPPYLTFIEQYSFGDLVRDVLHRVVVGAEARLVAEEAAELPRHPRSSRREVRG